MDELIRCSAIFCPLSIQSFIHPSIHSSVQTASNLSITLPAFFSVPWNNWHAHVWKYYSDWICDKSPWIFKSKYLLFKLYLTEFISSMLHLMAWWLFQLFIILTFKFRVQKANGRYVNFRFFKRFCSKYNWLNC